MNTFTVYMLLCAATTAREDCNTKSAIDLVLGPEVHNEIMCGLESQEMLAKTTLIPRNGEYIKISCVRQKN